MPARHQIIDEIVAGKYLVPDNVGEILGGLSFKPSGCRPAEWDLYVRKNGHDEFAAVHMGRHGERDFLVTGPYSSIEVPVRDLETITRYVFHESWLSRLARGRHVITTLVAPTVLTIIGIAAYDMLIREGNASTLRDIAEYAQSLGVPEGLASGVPFFAPFLAGVAAVGVGRLVLNRLYGSRLSPEAESYDYGQNAKTRLEEELAFNKVRSGELTKAQFLNNRGFDVWA